MKLTKMHEELKKMQADIKAVALKLVEYITNHEVYEFLRNQDDENGNDKWHLGRGIYKTPFIQGHLMTVDSAYASCCTDEIFEFELPSEIFLIDFDAVDVKEEVLFVLDKWLAKLKLEDEYKQKLRELDEPN